MRACLLFFAWTYQINGSLVIVMLLLISKVLPFQITGCFFSLHLSLSLSPSPFHCFAFYANFACGDIVVTFLPSTTHKSNMCMKGLIMGFLLCCFSVQWEVEIKKCRKWSLERLFNWLAAWGCSRFDIRDQSSAASNNSILINIQPSIWLPTLH